MQLVSCENTQISSSNVGDKRIYNKDWTTSDTNKKGLMRVWKDYIVNTLESCTSSEFREGLGVFDEQSFISQGNNDIENLNIVLDDKGS